jgi:NAD(P)-dependent dehydrogenase (short-subunit alcohol dehydrogenase family)
LLISVKTRRERKLACATIWPGKVALVTGGSRGIGAAVARALASAGADVAITYLNSRQAAENVAAEMRAMEVRTRSVRADQADPAAAAAVVRQVADELGRLDILVNNAAVAVLGPIDSLLAGDAALDRQVRVNYTSIVAAVRAAAHVLPDGGRIINIGSGVATRTGASGSPTTRARRRRSAGSPGAPRVTWPRGHHREPATDGPGCHAAQHRRGQCSAATHRVCAAGEDGAA